jgi:hypothetical protein
MAIIEQTSFRAHHPARGNLEQRVQTERRKIGAYLSGINAGSRGRRGASDSSGV